MTVQPPPTSPRRQNAVPTNTISYKGSVPARIDPAARIGYIVEIMTNTFGAAEHHITLCLRDEDDELVTQTNLAAKVKSQEPLKLVSSPATEALSVVLSLQRSVSSPRSTISHSSLAVAPLKLALFNLQKHVKEEEFATEFMLRGGTGMLINMLLDPHDGLSGNSLAYALQGLNGLLEFEGAWRDITDNFIDRLLALLVSALQPNVLRPASAIVRKVFLYSISTGRVDGPKGKMRARESRMIDPRVDGFGFDRAWERMELMEVDDGTPFGAEGVIRVITKRLEGTGDLELVAESLGLINAVLQSADQGNASYHQQLLDVVRSLAVSRYVSRLMPTCKGNIVEPQILLFQARYAAVLNHYRLKQVRPSQYPHQDKMLQDIWTAGRLGEEPHGMDDGTVGHVAVDRDAHGWRRIGLEADDTQDLDGLGLFVEGALFRNVGELGLDCLHHFVTHHEGFHDLVVEQEARGRERRCPLGKASSACVQILCDHYRISMAGQAVPNQFQLFLLSLPRLHTLVLKFFLRMWSDSESNYSDFDRLALLVRTQVRQSLINEGSKTWLHLEKDFLETDYRTIRDQQMELLEREDGLLNKGSVTALKLKLGIEAQEVVSDQRVGCMMQGAWFNSSSIIVPGIISSHKASPTKPLRFVRLSPNKRVLAWGEFSSKPQLTPSFESLRERIDLANVTELHMETGCPVKSRSPNLISKLSFSLLSGPELSLLDLDAIHSAQMAEWVDGIRALKGQSTGWTKETEEYMRVFTELALKVRLLDITGDGVDLPDKVAFSDAPTSTDFWFAE